MNKKLRSIELNWLTICKRVNEREINFLNDECLWNLQIIINQMLIDFFCLATSTAQCLMTDLYISWSNLRLNLWTTLRLNWRRRNYFQFAQQNYRNSILFNYTWQSLLLLFIFSFFKADEMECYYNRGRSECISQHPVKKQKKNCKLIGICDIHHHFFKSKKENGTRH
jgi:hypothetical protein